MPLGLLGTLALAAGDLCYSSNCNLARLDPVAYGGFASIVIALIASLLAAIGGFIAGSRLSAATRLLGTATGLVIAAIALFTIPGVIVLGAFVFSFAFWMLPAAVVLFIAFQRGRSLQKSAGSST
jgi:hypothetical protein